MKWTMKELFDEDVVEVLTDKSITIIVKCLRIVILLVVIFQFFVFTIIPTSSMYPTINRNDLIILRHFKEDSLIKRGQIVSFLSPVEGEERLIYVKRVIGLPGETIEIKNGSVYINDTLLDESSYEADTMDYEHPKVTIGDNDYFLLGDNRNDSFDSSAFGSVNRDRIKGMAVLTLLPFKRFGEINPKNIIK